MNYVGSKSRIAKGILPIMLKGRGSRTWVEPFVGGGNLIQWVDGSRIGADANPRVIDALKLIRDIPEYLPRNNDEFTETDYTKLRGAEDQPLRSFAGFAYSFGAKWFAGWCRNSEGRDYVEKAYNSAQRQSPRIKCVELVVASYSELCIPRESIIYCDPPYKGTQGYGLRFDHEAFWQWARDRTDEGHLVYVSEYEAPGDFVSVWSKQINSSLSKNTGAKKGVEKLFVMDDLAL